MGKKSKKRDGKLVLKPNFEVIVLLFVLLTAVLSLVYYFSSDNQLTGYQTASSAIKSVDLTSQTEKARDGMIKAGIQLAKVKTLEKIYIGKEPPSEAPSISPTAPDLSVPHAPEIQPSAGGEQPSEPSTSQSSGSLNPFVPPSVQTQYRSPEQTSYSQNSVLNNTQTTSSTQANITNTSLEASPSTNTSSTASPSPTTSPTVSPTVSPTASPTASPSPTQGPISNEPTLPPLCNGKLAISSLSYDYTSQNPLTGRVKTVIGGFSGSTNCNGLSISVKIENADPQVCIVSGSGCEAFHTLTNPQLGKSYTVTAYASVNGQLQQASSQIVFAPLSQSGQNDFSLTLTGSSEINEGGRANLDAAGTPVGEENAVTYYFTFGTPTARLPTETDKDDVRTSVDGKASVSPVYTNTGTYTQ